MIEPDARMLLARADAMADAADRVAPRAGQDPAPYLLLRALATELTLKALLLEAKGRFPRVHSLRALLGDLPRDERGRVDRLHRGLYRAHHPGADDVEADAVLEGIADGAGDAFQAARYPFDHDLGEVPDPEPLRRVARGRLLELLAPARRGGV
ncbi:MAG: HEPN domain-containing protein [Deinococcus-Thermus bacterium]|nr:HEPN domain-containing protein [Deinococcota bacterium]